MPVHTWIVDYTVKVLGTDRRTAVEIVSSLRDSRDNHSSPDRSMLLKAGAGVLRPMAYMYIWEYPGDSTVDRSTMAVVELFGAACHQPLDDLINGANDFERFMDNFLADLGANRSYYSHNAAERGGMLRRFVGIARSNIKWAAEH